MKANIKAPANIDEYIKGWPKDIQAKLQAMRETIQKAAPEAEETISYAMPTFKLNGNLVHFAAYQNHVGFYPVPSGMKEFEKELSVYKSGKGSAQFPHDQPLPLALVTKIVKFRVQLQKEKIKTPAKKKK